MKTPLPDHFDFLIGLFLFMLISARPDVFAQEFKTESIGGNVTLCFKTGTKLNSIGILLQGYYYKDHVQINGNIRGLLCLSSFVPKKRGLELQSSLGAVICPGDRFDSLQNPYLHSLSNQTGTKYSFGYAINLYLDTYQTSQTTGTISLQADKFQLLTENDILGSPSSDRYRTAGLLLLWREKDWQFGLNTTLWTGNPTGSIVVKDSDYPSNYGYVDMSTAKYGHLSSGIMSIQVQYAFPFQQIAQANIGMDSERIRHFWQNRLMHDMYILPKKWNPSKNPHIPMVDEHGLPYLYHENQVVKKSHFYFQTGFNQASFY